MPGGDRILPLPLAVEELHELMNTGLKIEQSQLSDYRRLTALAGIVSVVSIFLLQTKYRGPHPTPMRYSTQVDPVAQRVLSQLQPPQGRSTPPLALDQHGPPRRSHDRKGDGDPAWLKLWRGWQMLSRLTRGHALNST